MVKGEISPLASLGRNDKGASLGRNDKGASSGRNDKDASFGRNDKDASFGRIDIPLVISSGAEKSLSVISSGAAGGVEKSTAHN